MKNLFDSGEVKIMKEFVWINRHFFLNLAFRQGGEKNEGKKCKAQLAKPWQSGLVVVEEVVIPGGNTGVPVSTRQYLSDLVMKVKHTTCIQLG